MSIALQRPPGFPTPTYGFLAARQGGEGGKLRNEAQRTFFEAGISSCTNIIQCGLERCAVRRRRRKNKQGRDITMLPGHNVICALLRTVGGREHT